MKYSVDDITNCPNKFSLSMRDTMNVINGKWKIPIIIMLTFGKRRFKDLSMFPRITPRMLSKELKELELNGIINRVVHNTYPARIEYELTDSGRKMQKIFETMIEWGIEHRKINMENWKEL